MSQPIFCLTETASDQSDVEGRIRALNQELMKRKREAEQLKKEAKRRDKERLKAQEASLKKQIEVSRKIPVSSLMARFQLQNPAVHDETFYSSVSVLHLDVKCFLYNNLTSVHMRHL